MFNFFLNIQNNSISLIIYIVLLFNYKSHIKILGVIQCNAHRKCNRLPNVYHNMIDNNHFLIDCRLNTKCKFSRLIRASYILTYFISV